MSATDLILRLIEHEVPKYGLVHLLDLPDLRFHRLPLLPADDLTSGNRLHGARRA